MAKEASLADVFEPITLNLMGPKYLLKPPTRTLEEKSEEWEAKVDALAEPVQKLLREGRALADEGKPGAAEGKFTEADVEAKKSLNRDAQVKALIEILDLSLEPVEVPEGERPKTAKSVLSKLYKDDKIGKATLDSFLEQIKELREEQRPT
jgi:hypothetical protein